MDPTRFDIPHEFPGILKAFARAVLRQKPATHADLVTFASDYFTLLAGEPSPLAVTSSTTAAPTPPRDAKTGAAAGGNLGGVSPALAATASRRSPYNTIDATKRKEEIFTAAFRQYDQDGSGEIDIGELKSLLHDLEWDATPQELQDALAILDEDGSGHIDLAEFLRWTTYAWRKVAHAAPRRVSMSLRSRDKKRLSQGKRFMQVSSTPLGSLAE